MAYKIKKKSREFYNREEEKYLKKRYHGRPPVSEIVKEGTRESFNAPYLIHQKGSFVEYRDQLGKVKKVNKQGVYLILFDKEDPLTRKTKTKFIKEKNYVKHATPYYMELGIERTFAGGSLRAN
jgi:hypothetical protein